MSIGFSFHIPGYYPSFFKPLLKRNVETSYIATTVFPSFYKHIVIEFEIPSHWGHCLFNVYRAESDVGPWRKITPTPIDGNYFKDTGTLDFSKFMQGWYLVEVQLPDGQLIQGPPTSWENKRLKWVEIRAQEIERRETILLEKFTGVRTMFFRRRQFGMRCPECWDPQTERITEDHCTTCLGTSFKGGYYPGYETLLQYEPSPNSMKLAEQGTVESNEITAWTISTPRVEVQDVIVRIPDWKLFRVEHTVTTEMQTLGVRQILSLVELARGSIEYELAKQAMPEGYT